MRCATSTRPKGRVHSQHSIASVFTSMCRICDLLWMEAEGGWFGHCVPKCYIQWFTCPETRTCSNMFCFTISVLFYMHTDTRSWCSECTVVLFMLILCRASSSGSILITVLTLWVQQLTPVSSNSALPVIPGSYWLLMVLIGP